MPQGLFVNVVCSLFLCNCFIFRCVRIEKKNMQFFTITKISSIFIFKIKLYKVNMRVNFFFSMLLITMLLGCGDSDSRMVLQPGVSKKLAQERAGLIGHLSYDIRFNIPKECNEKVDGYEIITFDFKRDLGQVVLDFTGDASSIKNVMCNEKEIAYELINEHIVISSKYLKKRGNRIAVKFLAGDQALNRKDDLMYTLLVPDRARTVFPCFDQPDLKAYFKLELDLPKGWTAISNASIADSVTISGSRTTFKFQQSDLISTYLFSFTAGKFSKAQKEIDGKKYAVLYRENDAKKVAQNLDSIFYMVDYSVRWMERYTGILYPFQKYDLAIIPFFQFSGMEHPGSVFYVDSKMFLAESATQPEKIARAELIAHETAHLWFGDLVTMPWFDDVWMKEVFAGFFADKIVKELFPSVNSDLQFLIAHAPKAYSEDRTKGTNPIKQRLENLNLAGTMYGNIIYHKAPIVIRSLEKLMGQYAFQNALREYLRTYSLGNASWGDLVKIFDKHARFSVKDWSKSWVESAGMPIYAYDVYYKDSVGCGIVLRQKLPSEIRLPYLQLIEFTKLVHHKETSQSALLGKKGGKEQVLIFPKCRRNNDCFIPNSNGFGYGYFELDSLKCASIVRHYQNLKNPVHRASCIVTLYENMLNGNFDGKSMLALLVRVVEYEKNELLISMSLDYLLSANLYFISKDDAATREMVECSLWNAYSHTNDNKLKIQYLRTIAKVMHSEKSARKMHEIWSHEVVSDNRWIGEMDLQNFAFELCIRMPEESSSILNVTRKSIKNIDNLRRFNFISQAVDPKKIVRVKLFESLLHLENRKQEAWVADALKLLNHPLRNDESEEYLAKGLSILPEIQQTGDIFFPKNWLSSLLYGHTSADDYAIVCGYISKEGKSISPSLLSKVYQCSDLLKRSTSIASKK